MKIWWHKITHWEYWPVYLVYGPAFFLWLIFAIRFRRWDFFRYSNPTIKNGGLFGDSKFAIYGLLPKELYPRTILIKKNEKPDFLKLLQEHDLDFPVLVKPDIGCRGVLVEKARNLEELVSYQNMVGRDFLIQEICTYANEIGLFYLRIPGRKKGKILGITFKKFLTITGNGMDTMEELLRNNPRFEMQIGKLKKKMDLGIVIPYGMEYCPVPFGNHNRGTEFLDISDHITPQLLHTFDAILGNIDGFYYGRLDIRFESFEKLEKGEKFSIIELNGAKSEPTHIYDPKHSFWYGQKEIFRYQLIFGEIVKKNIQNPEKRNSQKSSVKVMEPN